MKQINIVIDGQSLTVPAGSTILEAAREAGIYIPSLCYDDDLSAPQSCRLCIVEVEGMDELAVSCVTKVREGMKIQTNTDLIRKVRQATLELMLANHPQDCMKCDKAGICELQNHAYWYNAEYDFFEGECDRFAPEEVSPFIYRDPNKCIYCGKCVRVCKEIVGKNALEFDLHTVEGRTVVSYKQTADNSDCIHCGNCVAACPVGALVEAKMKGSGRCWETEKISTICPYCGVGCTIDINIREGKMVGITSNLQGRVNGRYLCTKGRFGYDFVTHPDRLLNPYIKRNGRLVKSSWQEALEFAASKLTDIKERHGGKSMALLGSARCTNEENYLAGKFARAVLGTNNVDNCARLCHSPTMVGLGKVFGSGAMTNSIDEIGDTQLIMVLGSNVTETHPVIGLKIKQAVSRGAALIVIDPRKTELAQIADYHLQLNPGTDIALLNAMANTIISEDIWDREFVWNRTKDFHSMRLGVKECSPEWASKITGVPTKDIIEAARKYAESYTGMIFYTMGITQHSHGTDNVLAIANLALLTGKIGREFCGVNPLRGQNNVQGACDMGTLPHVLSGYQKIEDDEVREKFSYEWQCDIPQEPGLTSREILDSAYEGEMKAAYIIGQNPVISEAETEKTIKALEKLDFLLVQDIFMTETAEMADVVFPAAAFAEKDGTFTNTERRVQRVRKAFDPPGDSKPDWQIFYDLAKAMRYSWRVMRPRDIMKEISRLTPIYGGISYPRIAQGGLQWPCYSVNHPGTKFLYENKFSAGSRARFQRIAYQLEGDITSEDFPLILITGRRFFHYHTGTMTRKVTGLNALLPEEVIQINPEEALNLEIREADWVNVISKQGKITARVRLSSGIPPGVIFASFHFHEVLVNKLTSSSIRDSESKISQFKRCAVRLEKTEANRENESEEELF